MKIFEEPIFAFGAADNEGFQLLKNPLAIFGPHAVGKMTVGQELSKITNLKLFHNHMTIDIVSRILLVYLIQRIFPCRVGRKIKIKCFVPIYTIKRKTKMIRLEE